MKEEFDLLVKEEFEEELINYFWKRLYGKEIQSVSRENPAGLVTNVKLKMCTNFSRLEKAFLQPTNFDYLA